MSSAAESAFAEGQAQVSPTLAPDQSIPPTESAEKPHKKISAAEAAFAEGQGVAPEQEDVPFAEKLKTTPYEGLSKLQQDRLTTFTTPEEIAQIPKHIPKTDFADFGSIDVYRDKQGILRLGSQPILNTKNRLLN